MRGNENLNLGSNESQEKGVFRKDLVKLPTWITNTFTDHELAKRALELAVREQYDRKGTIEDLHYNWEWVADNTAHLTVTYWYIPAPGENVHTYEPQEPQERSNWREFLKMKIKRAWRHVADFHAGDQASSGWEYSEYLDAIKECVERLGIEESFQLASEAAQPDEQALFERMTRLIREAADKEKDTSRSAWQLQNGGKTRT